jgi:GT2 family glycosyltransferase
VGAVSGRVSCSSDTPVSKITKVGRIRKYDGKIIANFNADFRTDVEHAYGCNFSFRKELLTRIGGYDERLIGTGSFDDADLSFKIRKLGYRIVFDPLAEAIHLQSSGGYRDLLFAEKMYWYYHNFMIFYLKNLKKLFFPIFLLRQIGSIIRRAVIFKDFRIIYSGLKGLGKGFIDYFKKPGTFQNVKATA